MEGWSSGRRDRSEGINSWWVCGYALRALVKTGRVTQEFCRGTSTFGGLVGSGTLVWVPRSLALDLRVHTLSCFVQVVVFIWEVSMETADSRFTGN